MRQPYAGEADYRGYPTMSDGQVCSALRHSARDGMQLLAHCNGDAAAEQLLRCAGQVEEEGLELASLRPVMVHAQLLGRDQLAAVQRVGLLLSFFPNHVYHWGDVHIQSFGWDRAAAISPAASALRRGIPFTFHQDTPVLPPDMLESGVVRGEPADPGREGAGRGGGDRGGGAAGRYGERRLPVF